MFVGYVYYRRLIMIVCFWYDGNVCRTVVEEDGFWRDAIVCNRSVLEIAASVVLSTVTVTLQVRWCKRHIPTVKVFFFGEFNGG